jgi:hypothetical protein
MASVTGYIDITCLLLVAEVGVWWSDTRIYRGEQDYTCKWDDVSSECGFLSWSRSLLLSI